ncbi:MAG: FHA domain-containing protein [Polyangiaceae bacterium]
MSLLHWFNKQKRALARAERQERDGQYDAAVRSFLRAEAQGEAARVLLLRADAEQHVEQRLAHYARAAAVDVDGDHGQLAKKRSAALRFDLANAAGGIGLDAELRRIASELEACEHWNKAAEAYRLLGDAAGEVRALKGAGDIEALEQKLEADQSQAREIRERGALLKRLRDLEQLAERHAAICAARSWLEGEHRGAATKHDEEVSGILHRIRSGLITAPVVTLEVDGARRHYVIGEEVTVGRTRSDIVIASNAISRQHLRVFRVDGEPHVEDLDTRNGTMLSGARLASAIPVGDRLSLTLAGQIPCTIERDERGVMIDVAGMKHIASLGPLVVGSWRLSDAHDGEDHFVCLSTPADRPPPFKNDLALRRRIELAVGDAFSEKRGGPIVLSVPQQETIA